MAGGAFEVWPCGDASLNYRLGARVSLTHQIFAMFALLCVLQLHALLNICIKMAFSSACCLVVEIWTYYLCSSTDNLLQSQFLVFWFVDFCMRREMFVCVWVGGGREWAVDVSQKYMILQQDPCQLQLWCFGFVEFFACREMPAAVCFIGNDLITNESSLYLCVLYSRLQ